MVIDSLVFRVFYFAVQTSMQTITSFLTSPPRTSYVLYHLVLSCSKKSRLAGTLPSLVDYSCRMLHWYVDCKRSPSDGYQFFILVLCSIGQVSAWRNTRNCCFLVLPRTYLNLARPPWCRLVIVNYLEESSPSLSVILRKFSSPYTKSLLFTTQP